MRCGNAARAWTVWALLLAASVSGIVAFAAHGDGVIRRVEVGRLLARAEGLLRAHRIDEALPLLTRAVQVQPDHSPARRLLVRTLLRAGHFADAAVQAETGLTLAQPENFQDTRLLVDDVRRETGGSIR